MMCKCNEMNYPCFLVERDYLCSASLESPLCDIAYSCSGVSNGEENFLEPVVFRCLIDEISFRLSIDCLIKLSKLGIVTIVYFASLCNSVVHYLQLSNK